MSSSFQRTLKQFVVQSYVIYYFFGTHTEKESQKDGYTLELKIHTQQG